MIKLVSTSLRKVLKRVTKNLRNNESSSVFKGMLTLALGSSAARLIGFACIPIVTRIYSPADYGLLALYVSIVSILVPIATLRYSIAVPLPKTDALAMNLIVVGIWLIAFFSITFFLFLYLFGETVFAWFDMIEFSEWWWLVVFGVAGTATYELFSLWVIRKKKYNVIAKTQLTQSLIGNAAKITLGLLLFNPIGLIIGQVLAQSAGLGGLVKASVKDFKRLIPEVNIKRIKLVAIYYREFPYFRLPSQLLLQVSSNAPVLMMAALYSREVTGQLSLAIMAVSFPTGLIGQAMAKAFYAEIAAIGKRDLAKVRAITIDVQKKLFLVGIPLTILVMISAQALFKIVFGAEWETAGKYTAILSPFILLQFTSSPLVQVLNIVGSQLSFLFLNIIRVVGLTILFFTVNHFKISSEAFVYALSIFLFSYYLYQTFFVLKVIR